MNAKKHLKWIDGTKFIALMAVMIDHTAGVLRYSQRIQLISFFSVSLFILISGITAWIHEEKKQASSLKKYGTSIKKITYAYFGATFFYQIFNHKFFDFSQYFYYIILSYLPKLFKFFHNLVITLYLDKYTLIKVYSTNILRRYLFSWKKIMKYIKI